MADAIVFIHLFNFPVVEPERMIAAHAHLKTVVDQGRLTWKAYESETNHDASISCSGSKAAALNLISKKGS